MSRADGPLQVAVAGGSIGGLCAGLALHRIAGAEVVIYERHVGEVETRGAGIVVQPELTHHGKQREPRGHDQWAEGFRGSLAP